MSTAIGRFVQTLDAAVHARAQRCVLCSGRERGRSQWVRLLARRDSPGVEGDGWVGSGGRLCCSLLMRVGAVVHGLSGYANRVVTCEGDVRGGQWAVTPMIGWCCTKASRSRIDHASDGSGSINLSESEAARDELIDELIHDEFRCHQLRARYLVQLRLTPPSTRPAQAVSPTANSLPHPGHHA